MQFLLSFLAMFLLGFSSPTWAKSADTSEYERHYARITYYHDSGLNADPNSEKSCVGTTVAAHPRFGFGTKVLIPGLKKDGYYIVQDRGTAVTSKKASRGKAFVFDVYVGSDAEVHRLSKKKPQYMEVFVLLPDK